MIPHGFIARVIWLQALYLQPAVKGLLLFILHPVQANRMANQGVLAVRLAFKH